MLQPSVIILQNMTADLSLYEKSVSAAKVILTGFIVVFGMLLLLIGIIAPLWQAPKKPPTIMPSARNASRSL